jgi:adenylate cyclase
MTSRSSLLTRLRLGSGLVLMAFVIGHLSNHALTLYSLEAVEAGRVIFLTIWRSLPGSLLLYGALFVHIVLALWRLFERRRLRMPIWEAVQIGFGFAIPFWLALHILGTRGVHELFGVNDSYLLQFAYIWEGNPDRHIVMLLLVWLHGCIGLHFWLRIRSWYRRVQPVFLILAMLLPGAAIAGFALGGREVQAIIANNSDWLAATAKEQNWPNEAVQTWMFTTEEWIVAGFSLALVSIVLARLVRRWLERKSGRVQLRYLDGTAVAIEPGMSVLDGSRLAGIPHASVCGGRGRCSTCRVRVGKGSDALPPPDADETKVLERIGAVEGIRLACQLRPTEDLEVAPLLPAMSGPSASQHQVNPGAGIEREMAVLFADLRAFTRMAEGRLPFDVVFILNQYFKAMGAAIERSGGRVDKFIGDGIMALFGFDAEPSLACRQALLAAKSMGEALADLNRDIKADLPEPLRIGIGLHAGPVILGEMGYGRATSLTAIGDVVNVASRLEALTKEFDAELVVSARLARLAGVDLGTFDAHDIDIRGRLRPLRVHVIGDASTLPGLATGDGMDQKKRFHFTEWLGLDSLKREKA